MQAAFNRLTAIIGYTRNPAAGATGRPVCLRGVNRMRTAEQRHASAEVILASFVVAGLAIGLGMGFLIGNMIENLGVGLSLGALAGLVIGLVAGIFISDRRD